MTNTISSAVALGDVPTGRQLVDTFANILPATYAAGTVTLTPVHYEADVSPRPNGDHAVTIADWVRTGRYAVGLDPVTVVGGPTAGKLLASRTPAAKGLGPKDAKSWRVTKVFGRYPST